MDFAIRRALPQDAGALVAVLSRITAERVHSAIIQPWTADQQRRYLESLSPREVFHVAVTPAGEVIGYQSLDRWSAYLESMSHVAQLGTFLHPDWRRRGVGRALFQASEAFARAAGYHKFAICVRASNATAQAYYQQLGFTECGRLHGQVIIDGIPDDEIIMELSL